MSKTPSKKAKWWDFMHGFKQSFYGVKNCNCNRRRKDGLHNLNCASWKNAFLWKKWQKHILEGSHDTQ